MTNAELEVIEVAFPHFLTQTANEVPGVSSIIVPISSDLRGDIASECLRIVCSRC